MPNSTKRELELEKDVVSSTELRQVDRFKKEYTMRDKYSAIVDENLPKNINKLMRHIALYRQKNIEKLETPYPYAYPVWTPKDTSIYFEVTGIDEKEFKEDVAKIDYPSSYTMNKQFIINKYPHCIEMLIIRSMWKLKMDQNTIDVMLYYMGYNYWWQAYTVSFKFNPDKRVVEYTINNMSNRFHLKQLGSVNKLIFYAIKSVLDTYKKDIIEASDYKTFFWVPDRITTKFKGYVISFAKEFYKNNEKDDGIVFQSKSSDDEGELRDNESTMAMAISYANRYASKILSSTPSEEWLNRIAKEKGISKDDMRNVIQLIIDDKNSFEDLVEFFQAMFYIFLVDAKQDPKYIRSRKFFIEMNKVYKKGNTVDKNVDKIKYYLNKWLEAGSKTYRASNRPETKNKFRRGIFEYFVFVVAFNG